MFAAYRVRRKFQWRGWTFAPKGQEEDIPPDLYGGDIWLVEERHPRKEIMLSQRYAVGDATVPTVDELLRNPDYARLVNSPGERIQYVAKERKPSRRREKVAA